MLYPELRPQTSIVNERTSRTLTLGGPANDNVTMRRFSIVGLRSRGHFKGIGVGLVAMAVAIFWQSACQSICVLAMEAPCSAMAGMSKDEATKMGVTSGGSAPPAMRCNDDCKFGLDAPALKKAQDWYAHIAPASVLAVALPFPIDATSILGPQTHAERGPPAAVQRLTIPFLSHDALLI